MKALLRRASTSQTELLYQFLVATGVGFIEIAKELSPLSHHLQESPPGMVVLLMDLEMFIKVVYPLGQKGYLDLRRTGIPIMKLIL